MINNLNDFIKDFQSLVINSIDENKNPFSSYAPFIKEDGKYYVFISDMAKHTHNLRANNKCSLFFTEDEKECKNIFARKRAMIQCDALQIKKDSEDENSILDIFEKKFDESMVQTLRSMKDFHLFQFSPFYGEAVFGFGKAYNLGGENFEEFVQRESTGKGHGTK